MAINMVWRLYCRHVMRQHKDSHFSLVAAKLTLCPEHISIANRDSSIAFALGAGMCALWSFFCVWLFCHTPSEATEAQATMTRSALLLLVVVGTLWYRVCTLANLIPGGRFWSFAANVLVVRLFTIHSQEWIYQFTDQIRTVFAEHEGWQVSTRRKVDEMLVAAN